MPLSRGRRVCDKDGGRDGHLNGLPAGGTQWRRRCDGVAAPARRRPRGVETSPDRTGKGEARASCRTALIVSDACQISHRTRHIGRPIGPFRPVLGNPEHRSLGPTHTDIGTATNLSDPRTTIENQRRCAGFRNTSGRAKRIDQGEELRDHRDIICGSYSAHVNGLFSAHRFGVKRIILRE